MVSNAWQAAAVGVMAAFLACGDAVASAGSTAAALTPRLETSGIVSLVHGCHRVCEWGPGEGWWHRHGGNTCRAIRCDGERPPGWWDEPGYRRYSRAYRFRPGCRVTPWGEVFCRF